MKRFLLLAALALAGCAAAPPPLPPGSVRVAPGLVLVLPQPAELGRSLEATQLVTAHYGAQTFVFEGHVSATPERLLLVGLDPMGRKALSVTWSASGIQAETAPWLPEQLHPENMLADLVLLYWPEAVVRRGLAGSGGTVTSGARSRSIGLDGQELIHADYGQDDAWTGSLHYRNLAWGYGLDVQSAEVAR
jgi:hypothetical protein